VTNADTTQIDWPARWKFTLVSLSFFHITASTFSSLGVVFPYMIEEFSWSYSDLGLGFSILAFLVGITGRIPAWTLRRVGTGITYFAGGIAMALGFAVLAMSSGLGEYFTGAALAGLGFALCATVPGVAVIGEYFPHRRTFAIGAYMAIGGLGGVFGPMFVPGMVSLTGSWRMHWWAMATTSLVLAVLAIMTFGTRRTVAASNDDAADSVKATSNSKVYTTSRDWKLPEVLKTPQYYVIVAAMTMTLFGVVTTNTWAVTHMGVLGISVSIAAGALSAQALVNAVSRAFGGAFARWIDPKWLLVSALVAEIVGMVALSFADNPLTIALFVIGEGYGFGMCLFATTMLLINYYGPNEAPKTMGTMHLFTTVAAVGPVLGGIAADSFGGFGGVFRTYAVLLFVCLFAVIWMRPPTSPDPIASE